MSQPPDKTAPKDSKNPGYREQYGIVVLCRDEAQQSALYEKLRAQLVPLGHKIKLVVT